MHAPCPGFFATDEAPKPGLNFRSHGPPNARRNRGIIAPGPGGESSVPSAAVQGSIRCASRAPLPSQPVLDRRVVRRNALSEVAWLITHGISPCARHAAPANRAMGSAGTHPLGQIDTVVSGVSKLHYIWVITAFCRMGTVTTK